MVFKFFSRKQKFKNIMFDGRWFEILKQTLISSLEALFDVTIISLGYENY